MNQKNSGTGTSSPTVTSASIQDLLVHAFQQHQSSRLDEAKRLYCRVLAADPRSADALHLLGVLDMQTGRCDAAVRLIGRAIAVHGEGTGFHYNLGLAYQGLGLTSEALVSYDVALCLAPSNTDVHTNRASILQDLGRLEEALTSRDAAVGSNPGSAEAHYNRGCTLHLSHRLNDARVEFAKAICLRADYGKAYCNLGNALKESGAIDAARTSYQRSIILNPGYAPSHANLGSMLMDLGRLSEAQLCLELGMDRAAIDQWIVASVALIAYWSRGLYAAADAVIETISGRLPSAGLPKHRPQEVVIEYISTLLRFRTAHPGLYKPTIAADPLIALGDSHCLALNGASFGWSRGEKVTAASRIVTGVKMFHLARPGDRRYYPDVLSSHLKRLPAGVHLLFTIGEIDARPDEGIWKALARGRGSLDHLIASTVDGYFDWLARELADRAFPSITIQGIPAPNYLSQERYSAIGKEDFISMVQALDRRMKHGAAKRGWRFLDVYSATQGPGGVSSGEWHLDANHLKPSFYEHAEQWILG